MADLVKGWDMFAAAAQFNLAGTGTIGLYTQGNTYMSTSVDTLWPSNSVDFDKRWKMLKHATKRLAPGDTWVLPVHLPNTIYDPMENQAITGIVAAGGYVGTTSYLIAKANEGRVFVTRQRGEIGVSDADENVYGWMKTNVYHGTKQTARVRKLLIAGGNSISFAITKDTDANDLVSPSLFHMVKAIDDGAIDDV